MKKFDWKSILRNSERADARRQREESFIQSEDGLMTIFVLGLIMVIFAVSGFAVDIMRFDHERARLQYSLDRAVLASTDLAQDLCPDVVIKDYLEKEGLAQYLVGEPTVTPPNLCGSDAITIQGFRRVEATAEMDVQMHFMQWWGVDYITTSVNSAAEEAIGDVEISLVLDVSGSMNNNSRLTTLKLAAQDFVQEMVDKSEDGKMSISIVPYAAQVALPDAMMNQLNTDGVNPHANCINFEAEAFQTSDFDLDFVYDRTLHFTNWGTYDQRPNDDIVYNEICETSDNREILAFQKDAQVLKDKIQAFTAEGSTSIDLGVKWGLTLLDDSFQPIIAQMAAAGEVPAEFASRPDNPQSNDTLKVMVLMTDGSNTTQYWVNDPYRAESSGVWWNEGLQQYVSYAKLVNGEIYTGIGADYVWPDVDIWEWNSSGSFYWARERYQPRGYGNTYVDPSDMTYAEDSEITQSTDGFIRGYLQHRCLSFSNGFCAQFDYGTSRIVEYEDLNPPVMPSIHLTWPDLWETQTRYTLYSQLRGFYGSNWAYNWYYDAVSSNSQSTKDPRVKAMCQYAKDRMGVVIFTISLEAPEAGRAILQSCRSDPGSYYEATPDNLPNVFASISSSIRNLRLTQ